MYESLINSLLARYQITPIELFDRLAHAKLSKLKEDVFLRSDKCPKEMYLKYKDYIANSISSPCSTEEDIILYYNKNPFDELAVLSNPNCPKEVIEQILERTSNLNVFYKIASHKNSDSKILSKLWKLSFEEELYGKYEEYEMIRLLIIKNPNCSKKIVNIAMGNGSSNELKIALLGSKHCTKKVYENIFQNRYSFHSKRKDFDESELLNISGLEDALALNKHCDAHHLKELVNDCESNKHTYSANTAELLMAINPNVLHKKTLIQLSKSDNIKVLRNLSLNPSCPSDALLNVIRFDVTRQEEYREFGEVLEETEAEILKNVMDNPNLDSRIFTEIVSKLAFRKGYHYVTAKEHALENKFMNTELLEILYNVNMDNELGINKVADEPIISDVSNKFTEINKEEVKENSYDENLKEVINSVRVIANRAMNLEEQDPSQKDKVRNSVDVGEDVLFEIVDDHFEIRQEFIPVLKYLNLEHINCRNLKVSGIDFTGTNIRINPQMVYMKDLSNSIFENDNIVGDLTDCNTTGSNIPFVEELIL